MNMEHTHRKNGGEGQKVKNCLKRDQKQFKTVWNALFRAFHHRFVRPSCSFADGAPAVVKIL